MLRRNFQNGHNLGKKIINHTGTTGKLQGREEGLGNKLKRKGCGQIEDIEVIHQPEYSYNKNQGTKRRKLTRFEHFLGTLRLYHEACCDTERLMNTSLCV